jgi:hypothetical protein
MIDVRVQVVIPLFFCASPNITPKEESTRTVKVVEGEQSGKILVSEERKIRQTSL